MNSSEAIQVAIRALNINILNTPKRDVAYVAQQTEAVRVLTAMLAEAQS